MAKICSVVLRPGGESSFIKKNQAHGGGGDEHPHLVATSRSELCSDP